MKILLYLSIILIITSIINIFFKTSPHNTQISKIQTRVEHRFNRKCNKLTTLPVQSHKFVGGQESVWVSLNREKIVVVEWVAAKNPFQMFKRVHAFDGEKRYVERKRRRKKEIKKGRVGEREEKEKGRKRRESTLGGAL